MGKRLYSFPVWLVALMWPPGGAVADVYVRTDAAGVVHYTNTPVESGYELIVAVVREEGRNNRAGAEPKGEGARKYAEHVASAAAEFDVEEALVHAVITAESAYNPGAVSRAGAQGLMQLMPGTAQRYAVADAFDPEQNIRGGTRYLSDLLRMFEDNLELAVAAYNAGEQAVIKYGKRVPPYKETKAYVPKVLALYKKYQEVF